MKTHASMVLEKIQGFRWVSSKYIPLHLDKTVEQKFPCPFRCRWAKRLSKFLLGSIPNRVPGHTVQTAHTREASWSVVMIHAHFSL
jgi:hypothetical protein